MAFNTVDRNENITLTRDESTSLTLTFDTDDVTTTGIYTVRIESETDTVEFDIELTLRPSANLYYRLDDDSDSTVAVDSIENNNNGTITNGTYDSDSFHQEFALSYNGTDTTIGVPDATLVPSSADFTTLIAVKPTDPANNQYNLLTNDNEQTGFWRLDASASDGGAPTFTADNLGADLTASSTLPTDRYSVVGLRRDGDTFDLLVDYNDGTGFSVEDTITETASLDNSEALEVGNRQLDDTMTYDGLLDEVYIDSEAMTNDELKGYPY